MVTQTRGQTDQPAEPFEPQCLRLWTTPSYYGGAQWHEWYVIAGRSRDSDLIEESNYHSIFRILREKLEELRAADPLAGYIIDTENLPSKKQCQEHWYAGYGYECDCVPHPDPKDSEEDCLCDTRAGHWAVGWVETIFLHKDAPRELLELADSLRCALSDYPVLDEHDYCEREHEETLRIWKQMRMRDRIALLAECEESIFAARRSDDIPEETWQKVQEMVHSG